MVEDSGGNTFPKPVTFVLVTLPRLIIGSLILVAIVINIANVIGRYVFGNSIIWAEEAIIFIMVWCVFIGAALVTWHGQHLKMDLLSVTLPPRWKHVVNWLAVLTFVAICFFILPESWTVVSMMDQFGQKSMVLALPMSIPHSAILLGFVLMLIAMLLRLRANITGSFETEIDHLVGKKATDEESSAGTTKA